MSDFVNDAYLVVDMRLGFQRTFGKMGVEYFAGIDNLLDKRYNGSIHPNEARNRFFEPASGRSWFAGINIAFPGNRVQQ
jgi:iron complex outermembrane receptor protein